MILNKPSLIHSLKSPQSLLVLALGLIMTILSTFYVSWTQKQKQQRQINSDVEEIQARIRGRIERYENALIQTRAYLKSHPSLSRQQFKDYVTNTEILDRYPGIQGVGYTVKISANELKTHERTFQGAGFMNYTVWPKSPDRMEYFSIIFLEPMDWRNERAIGFDMFSEPIRNVAMQRARDTGRPAITGRVTLVQETEKDSQPGFLIYVPVYQKNMNTDTIEARRKALIGFVYAPFRANDFFSVLFPRRNMSVDFGIFDGRHSDKEALLYDYDGKDSSFISGLPEDEVANRKITIAGHSFILTFTPTHKINLIFPISSALVGFVVTLLLWWIFVSNKANAIEIQKEQGKYEAIFEKSPTAIAVLRGQDHIFEMINPAYKQLIGGRDVVGKNLMEALPEIEGQPFSKMLDNVFITGEPISIKDASVHLLDSEGKVRERFVDFVYQRIEERGKPYGIFVQAIDTTNKVLALNTLKENELRIQAYMESMPQMGFIADAHGNMTYFNKRHYEYFGLDPEVQTDWKWLTQPMHHPDDFQRTVERWTRSIQTGEPYEIQYRLRRHDGKFRWHLGRAMPSRDSNGEIKEWFGTNTDIHDQKEAMEKIQESEARLKFALQAGEMGTWTIHLNTNELLLSEESYRIFGLSEGDRDYNQTISEIIHPDDQARARMELSSALTNKNSHSSEYRVVRKNDGEHRWIMATGGAHEDENGEISYFCGVIIDITKRKMTDLQLAEKSAFFQTVLEQMPVGAFFAEAPTGRMLFTNKKFRDLWRNPPSEIPHIEDYGQYKGFHPDGKPYLPEEWPLARALRTGEVVTGEETEVILFDGSRAVVRLNAAPIRNSNGDIIAGVVLSEDVTKIAEFQRQLADSLKARDEFLSIASHELKTPLTSMKLQNELFKRKKNRGDGRIYEPSVVDEMAEQTEKQISRLTRLIDDMLDIARIRSGKLVIEKEEFDLCEMMQEVLLRMKPLFSNSSYDFPIFDHCELAVGYWDKLRLEQVAVNLLTNAIRYGRGKTIKVEVKNLGNCVRFSVSDQGIGIAEKNLKLIFDRFERAVDATEVSGLGLGLFITKQIVTSHGGKIWVESKINEGATFTVELPKS